MAIVRSTFASFVLCAGALAGGGFEVTTGGSPGTDGVVPELSGTGPLFVGSTTNSLVVSDALAVAPALLVVGFSEVATPFKHGILGPSPDIILGVSIDGSGEFALPFAVPAITPPGTQAWIQAFITDAGSSTGLAASNTLRMTFKEKGASLFPGPKFLVPAESIAAGDFDEDGAPDLAIGYTNGVRVMRGSGDGQFAAPVSVAGQMSRFLTSADLNTDGHVDLVAAGDNSASVLLGSGDGTFVSQPLAGGASLSEPIIADFDNDGVLDIVCTRITSFTVWLGVGDGTFAAPIATALTHVRDITTADFDGDGSLDVAANGFFNVEIFRGQGDGSFLPFLAVPLPAPGAKICASDFDADGITDLAVVLFAEVVALFGTGGGSFSDAYHLGPVGTLSELRVSDLDGDSLPDILVSSPLTDEVAWWTSNRDQTFNTFERLSVEEDPKATTLADLDLDGNLDLAFSSIGPPPKRVSVLLGNEGASFDTAVWHDVGHASGAITSVDLNGDGFEDIVSASHSANETSVIFGDGEGSFGQATSYKGLTHSASVAHGDLNLDGHPDIVVSNRVGGSFSVLLGLGDGTLGPATHTPAHTRLDTLGAIAVAELTGDGIPDVVISTPSAIEVHAGDGAGGSSLVDTLSGGPNIRTLLPIDVNADGQDDLVSFHQSGINVFLANGDATFTAQPTLLTGFTSWLGDAADINRDGALDLVATGSNIITAFLGNGDGTFAAQTTIATPPFLIVTLHLQDFNADGIIDIVGASSGPRSVAFLKGRGNLNFDEAREFALPDDGGLSIIADFDNDGLLDFAVTQGLVEGVSVLLNDL